MSILRVLLVTFLCINFLSCEAFKTGFNKGREGSLNYLKSEFEHIQSLPGSVEGHRWSTDKGRQGDIGAPYTTSQTYDAIKAHYDAELTKRGWRFLKTEKVIYNWRDRGGQHVFFCKDIYTADLQFAGEQEQEFGWTYNFSLSWGLFDTNCS